MPGNTEPLGIQLKHVETEIFENVENWPCSFESQRHTASGRPATLQSQHSGANSMKAVSHARTALIKMNNAYAIICSICIAK